MQNCWEFKRCEREPGGAAASELGVCPAATDTRVDGTNGGTNAGRACWAIAGSLCGGEVQGTFAQKLMDCGGCEFAHQVMRERGDQFENINNIRLKVNLLAT